MASSRWVVAAGVEGKMPPPETGHPVPPVVVVVVMRRPPAALLTEPTVFRDIMGAVRSQPAQGPGLVVAVAVALAGLDPMLLR